ncbi:MAG: hypothetical protein US31_C0002G0036 [Berkelbacteria bacterium GW2011_GWA1_36_9]|uniref:Uncharacterized protein n=1 Tax=Berkelbacteria bacterium GW2011_GWA1_36_9 TaxID=1618331 RepID=A0A0G0IRR5_9BACT|nr:MAG: hypothetical protein US31_C0002G0036 [Berkelbacteria bacterium GW2011_GWA1_36_9]
MNNVKGSTVEDKKDKDIKKTNDKTGSDWKEIKESIDYLVKTDRSNLSWRELLGRPHECNNR